MTTLADQTALDILDAKLALEEELIEPLAIALSTYLSTWEKGEGVVRIIDHVAHREQIEAVLVRHYARVVSVMSGRAPQEGDRLEAVVLSPIHAERLRARARNQTMHMIRGMDRDLMTILMSMPVPTIADMHRQEVGKSSAGGLETKKGGAGFTVQYIGRFKETAKQAWAKLKSRMRAIANLETESVAEEHQVEWVKQKHANARIWKTWNSLMDGRERPAHHEAHGQEVLVDQPFEVGGALLKQPGDSSLGAPLAMTINCFPADTRVSGCVRAATRHWFDGDIVEIVTSSGHHLAGTPNHPVLTPKGWVALCALHEGDHVIAGRLAVVDETARVDGERHHVDHVEPTIEQVFDALARGGCGVRKSALAVDFHGDIPAQDVDIVAADCTLRLGVEAGSGEDVGHLGLALADLDEACFFPGSLSSHLHIARKGTSTGRVGSSGNELPFVGSSVLEPQYVGLAAITRSEANVAQDGSDGGARDAHGASDTQDGCPVFEGGHNGLRHARPSLASDSGVCRSERSDDASFRNVLVGAHDADAYRIGDRLAVHAVQVEVDHVACRSVRHFVGHVYNLETVDGFYLANGIVAHNCRCFATYAMVGPNNERIDIPLQTPALPAKRRWRPGDRLGVETPVRATESITMTGRTRANVVLGDGRTFAVMQQVAPDTVVVRVAGRDIARATFSNGTVTNMTTAQDVQHLDVDGLIRRSVTETQRLLTPRR